MLNVSWTSALHLQLCGWPPWCLPGLQHWDPSCPTLHAVFMGISIWAEGLKIKNMIHPGSSEETKHCFPALLWVLSVLRSGCSFYPSIWCNYLPHFLPKSEKKIFSLLKWARTCFVTFSQIIQANMMLLLECHGVWKWVWPSVSLCMCVTQL